MKTNAKLYGLKTMFGIFVLFCIKLPFPQIHFIIRGQKKESQKKKSTLTGAYGCPGCPGTKGLVPHLSLTILHK